ncbi:MAG: hypothetical protein AcusKO_22470 [Acuticoccus sp.]
MRPDVIYKVMWMSALGLGFVALTSVIAFTAVMGITSWLSVGAIEWLIHFIGG